MASLLDAHTMHREGSTPRGSARRTPRTETDDDVPKDCISPNPDVFSYFTLKAPSERKEHRHFTVDAGMSYALVFLTLAIQSMLLYCVFNKVIGRNTNWQNGIMNTGKDWNIYQGENEGCNDGGSLCTLINGTFSCAPPSVQLIGQWDELDTNKDGIWSKSEVLASREALRCNFAVDPVEVFDVLITLLNQRKEHIWLHPSVEKREGIHQAYFTYIKGDVAMCGYRNEDMCGNLLKRGVFDAPLTNATVPRVGKTIRSALDYCRGLLEQGGFCERFLPSTYSTWKIESVQECGEPEYKKFVYTDQSDGHIKSLLEVDYNAREDYEVAKTLVFKGYKFCIVLIWFILIASRIREVAKCVMWVWQLPSVANEAEEAADDAADVHDVRYIDRPHRVALFVVVALRMAMLLILLYVGLNFLGRQTQYIDLLLDGVALMFIVEVAEIMYERVLRQDVKTQWEDFEPIELDKLGLTKLASRPDIEDVLYLLLVIALTTVFMVYYNIELVNPLYDALQCTCLGQGDRCQEASVFSTSFWDQYWTKDVPSSIQAITNLKSEHLSAVKEIPKAAGRAAVTLLSKYHQQQHLR